MTFSIIAREPCDGGEGTRFGIGITTNNPGVGIFCPFVSENGVVGAQYGTHGDVGPAILDRLDDGVAATEAVPDTIDSLDRSPHLQVHALCRESRAVHHGEMLDEELGGTEMEFGDISGTNYSVAGNCLANLETLTVAAETLEESSSERELADRLIEALVAGDEAGGDDRDIDARSAAVVVADPTAGIANEWYNDLRVDASETPLEDLRSQYELAKDYHETASEEW
jgi:uncharacterized Ntn-hydrolase superfamily protein